MFRSLIALTTVALVAIAGCSTSGRDDAASHRIESLLERVGDDMPQSQRSALSDLELTYDEYEAATLATIECMRESGIIVIDLESMNNGRYLGYSHSSSAHDADEPCRREHLAYVEQIWVDQQAPTAAESEEIRAEYQQCLEDAGENPPPDSTFEDLERYVALAGMDGILTDAGFSCAREHSVVNWISDP